MSGVVILQTITTMTPASTIICIIFLIILAICLSIVLFVRDLKEDMVKFCVILAGISVYVLLVLWASSITKEERYQIYLENNVDMTEFVETYTIVKQEGATYWVRLNDPN